MLFVSPALGTEITHVEMVSYRMIDYVVQFPLFKITISELNSTMFRLRYRFQFDQFALHIYEGGIFQCCCRDLKIRVSSVQVVGSGFQ